MAGMGRQMSGEGLPANLAGMSKSQLYDIMSQMKTLIDQNQQQARTILIQNPLLTKALFQAQIMLGMVQPPQPVQNTQQKSNTQEQIPNLNPVRMQQTMPQPMAPKPTPVAVVSQPSHAMAVQPPLPPQPRPSFQHHYPPPQQQQQQHHQQPQQQQQQQQQHQHQQQQQMGTNLGFQHPQHIPHPTYHTSNKPPPHVFPHPNQPPPQPVYQARGATEFNSQGDRGGSSSWAENPTQPRPQQPPQPPPPQLQGQPQSALSPEMEKALLQQVMSLTPEQINLLPPEQRNQVLHLQQILRQ